MAPRPHSPHLRLIIRRIRITGWTALSALLATVVAGVVWAQTPYPTHPEPLRELYARTDVSTTVSPDHILISPSDRTGPGVGQTLLFFPGARVDPHAYATTFSDTVANTGHSVLIVRPWFNLAIADPRPLSDFAALAPDTTITGVGGHSLGGVRACALATDDAIDTVVLMASYCATDLSDRTDLAVISLHGANDGLVDWQLVDDARGLLPAGSIETTLVGLAHASFGDYGPQSGDGQPEVERAEARAAITTALLDALDRLGD